MRQTFYSSWKFVWLSICGWVITFFFSLQARPFDQPMQIGAAIAIGYVIWLIWDRYTTYVAIEDNRWLINSEERAGSEYKIDIASVLYIARAPHFIFRSWGGRMILYFRDVDRKVKQTYLAETFYSQETLRAMLSLLTKIKPTIEVDPDYGALIANSDPNGPYLKEKSPARSIKDIEAYVTAKYGPPWG